MKLFFSGLFILLLSFFQIKTESFAQNEKKDSNKTVVNNRLEISLEQTDTRYCLYRLITNAFFTTKLKFKNTGDVAIILSKKPFEILNDELKKFDSESKVYKPFAKTIPSPKKVI